MECGASSRRHSSSYLPPSGKSLADTKQDPIALSWFVCLSLFFSLFLVAAADATALSFSTGKDPEILCSVHLYYLRSCERGSKNPRGPIRVTASSKERERTKALTKHSFLRERVRFHVAKYFCHFHLIMPGKSLQYLHVYASKSDTK